MDQKPAGVSPYQKTESRYLADMLCELFSARGIPYHRAEKTVRVPLATDAPDDDYGWVDRTTYYIDTTPAVAAKLRAAIRAANPAPGEPREVAERLREVYAAALDGQPAPAEVKRAADAARKLLFGD